MTTARGGPSLPPSASRRLESAVCARCGCLCDDIRLVYEGHEASSVENACAMGTEWLKEERTLAPAAWAFADSIRIDDAVRRTRDLLVAARAPIFLGLRSLTLEAAREALLLARRLEAPAIPWPPPHPAAARAGLDAPELSATLGEVRATADLVVFWRSDPWRDLPRHLERYSLEPPLRSGRSRRVIVIAGEEEAPERDAGKGERILRLSTRGSAGSPDLELALELARRLEESEEERKTGVGNARAAESAKTNDTSAAKLARAILDAAHTHFILGPRAGADLALRSVLLRSAARSRSRTRVTFSCDDGHPTGRTLEEVGAWLLGAPPPIAWLAAERQAEATFHPPGSSPPAANGPAGKNARGVRIGWIPGALREDTLAAPGLYDLAFVLGASPPGSNAFPSLAREARLVTLDGRRHPDAEVSFVVPALDPRLRATVVRQDGIHLTLCGGRGDGVPDPAAGILERLHGAVGEVAKGGA